MTAGESQPLAVVEARIIEIVVIIVAVIDDIIEIGAAGSALVFTFKRVNAKNSRSPAVAAASLMVLPGMVTVEAVVSVKLCVVR